MIVVGFLGRADALAVEIARRAAGTGARIEMIGAAAPGPAGDQRLLELAAARIGHATVIRSGADSLDAADLNLALRYLPDIRCIVLVRPAAGLLPTAIADAEWAGAPLVLVGPLEGDAIAVLDALDRRGPMLLEPPASDPDGAFAGFVVALAARLDAGDQPEAALRATVSALGAEPV
ncbi:MAG TPA: hypothetical protein VNL94_00955 [Candidatus Binatia bacterium]|nr:hypothetical protein [Candidatus Binatia bacterium]